MKRLFHSKINGIFDSVELNVVRTIVIRAIDCIIKAQRPLLVFWIAENKFEDSVFMMIVYAHLKKIAPLNIKFHHFYDSIKF